MRLRTYFLIFTCISVFIVVYLFIQQAHVTSKYEKTQARADFAYEVSTTVSQLTNLTNNYVLHNETRIYIQWNQRWEKLQKLLANAKFADLESINEVTSLQQRSNKIKSLFERTTSSLSDTKNSTNYQVRALTSQLLSMISVMDNNASRLYKVSKIERNEVHDLYLATNRMTFLTVSVMLLIFLAILFLRVIYPIKNIDNQLKSFDSTNPGKKLLFKNKDEIGNLVDSFNTVTELLKTTLVSRKRLQEEIAEKERIERSLNTFFEQPIHLHLIVSFDGTVQRANLAWKEFLGFTPGDMEKKGLRSFIHQDDQKVLGAALKTLEAGISISTLELRCCRDKQHCRTLIWSALPSEENGVIYMAATDITEQKKALENQDRLQRELIQSQKMDALGKLTGGVAHDFNNILAIILGNIELAIEKRADNHTADVYDYLQTIRTSCLRARDLVSQMLLFSRSEKEQNRPINILPVLSESTSMLKSILPASMEVEFVHVDEIPPVEIDKVKLQQVIMNLCVNAKDAMLGAGKLRITLEITENVSQECTVCHQLIKGKWIQLSISDTGSGISKEVLSQIFEPFFTTKAVNKGTGMGLSVVDGIVRNTGGHIVVDTEIGKGTTFRIFLPYLNETTDFDMNDLQTNKVSIKTGNGQKILLVDDELPILNFLSEILTLAGYTPVTKENSEEALALFLSEPDDYSLIITDQTMPQLTGIQLSDKMRESRPDLPIILMTGYSESINEQQAIESDLHFVRKPITTEKLIGLVNEIL